MICATRSEVGRRAILSAAGLVAVFAFALTATATPAIAYNPRTYESQLSVGPGPPQQIAVDSANRIWASEPNVFGSRLYEFNALSERLPTQIDSGGLEGSMAVDHSDNDLYVAVYGAVIVYSATGVELSEKTIFREGRLAVAADNSPEPSAGRLYLTRRPVEGGEPLNVVELLNESGESNNFPRYEEPSPPSYISGSKLTGTPAGPFTSPHAVAVGPHGEIYVADRQKVDEFESSGTFVREIDGSEAPGEEFTPTAISVDPTTADLVVTNGRVIDEFNPSGGYLGEITREGPSEEAPFSGVNGIAVNSAGFLYVATTSTHIDIFSPTFILPKVTYPGISGASLVSPLEGSATLNAKVDPDGGGEVTICEFEYVDEAQYKPAAANPFEAGGTAGCEPTLPYTGSVPIQFSANVSGFTPGIVYHYRVLVGNENGTAEAPPQTFELQVPSVKGVSAGDLTETTADLAANINPEGGETTCHFEYGTTTSYGQIAPCPAAEGLLEGDIGSLGVEHPLSVHLTDLEKGVVYHFRLVAENPFGATITEDQSFNFFPPSCPNGHLRQETGTEFLPDCRAYELVSPPDAGGTILLDEGPQSPLAIDPSRLAFGGILGKIPNNGGDPPNELGDLYVATRTDTGWTTRYIGLPATQSLVDDGPPQQAPFIEATPSGELTDLNMDQFMNWSDPYIGFYGGSHQPPGSYAPYLWDAEGNSLGRLPTNLGVVPGGEQEGEKLVGGTKPSPEFNHYFFSSNTPLSFAAGSLTHAPGSGYDDDLENNTVAIISKLPNGDPIEEGGGEITFPGVSTDGSHVLMSTGYSCGPCDPNYDFGGSAFTPSHLKAERHLFMRVGGGSGVTYPIALGHAVQYVGMTADGSKVYFTSDEKLTTEAEDSSTNLYMWSEKGANEGSPLTLISKPNGANATGTPVCPPTTWTTECGVVPYVVGPEMFVPDTTLHNGPGGNGLSDNPIASENGDIYFYSPQQLDGGKGFVGKQNLYNYRNGRVQYVTTFNSGPFCTRTTNCSQGPMVRIQVSPADTHMAFLTASKITSYENAGFLEMYSYDPATGNVHCVSCIPDGAPPTSNVEASNNGPFMTDDGRTFFSTADALVPQDTDRIRDVYEYIDGRPQLISSGTGSKESGLTISGTGLSRVGLVGVSANGTDAYFSTYDTLVARDRNGSALKFYDARIDGGFPESPPAAPCAAADECSGPSSSSAPASQNGTGAELTGGNLSGQATGPNTHRRQHKHKAHKRHHARHVGRRSEK